MGFWSFGWLVDVGKYLLNVLAPAGEAQLPAELGIPQIIQQALVLVQKAVKYDGMDTKAKFDAWLDAYDAGTGSDPAAINLIKGLPADKEEVMFDHVKEAARVYGYHLIGVEGYSEGL